MRASEFERIRVSLILNQFILFSYICYKTLFILIDSIILFSPVQKPRAFEESRLHEENPSKLRGFESFID